jgi:hypothetical protein
MTAICVGTKGLTPGQGHFHLSRVSQGDMIGCEKIRICHPKPLTCHSEEPQATKNPCICVGGCKIPGSFAVAQDDSHPNFFTASTPWAK